MDIRRLPLWEGRYATYMSNDIFSALIEDQGEVVLELTSRTLSGARINALSLPYFRGTGAGVLSDPNSEWWQGNEALYQAGGAYFTFPCQSGEGINSTDTCWSVRRYGTEEEHGGVWRLSEMKSREEGNRYRLEKVDMLLPSQPVLYTAVRITNTGDTLLSGSASWHCMLSSPLLETGSLISSNAKYYTAYALSRRESGINRFMPGRVFEELRHAPLVRGGTADAGYVPPPTGTYDYLIGKIPDKEHLGWVVLNNPKCQLLFCMFTPHSSSEDSLIFPNVDITENYLGRMDAPWALFDGATPEIRSVTCGFNTGPKGTRNISIQPGETRTVCFASGFVSYDNPRIGQGFYSVEPTQDGLVFKRTKSWAFLPADHHFRALKAQMKHLFTEESA